MTPSERVRRSVISRVIAAGERHRPEAEEEGEVHPQGHAMRHLFNRARLRHRQIVDRLLSLSRPEGEHGKLW